LTLDVAALRDSLTARNARLVAIDGRGGSGKSTFARLLAAGWPEAVVIEMDDFYLPSAQRVQPAEVHGANYDRRRLIAEVLDPLRAGRAGRYERYDWDQDELAEWHDVPAGAVVVLDGVYSTSELLRGYCDYAIWVDSPYDVRLRRGVERDGEAGRARWVEEWMPAEERYVEAEGPDARAALVLDGSGDGFEVLRLTARDTAAPHCR
jgi:uridine kinase